MVESGFELGSISKALTIMLHHATDSFVCVTAELSTLGCQLCETKEYVWLLYHMVGAQEICVE